MSGFFTILFSLPPQAVFPLAGVSLGWLISVGFIYHPVSVYFIVEIFNLSVIWLSLTFSRLSILAAVGTFQSRWACRKKNSSDFFITAIQIQITPFLWLLSTKDGRTKQKISFDLRIENLVKVWVCFAYNDNVRTDFIWKWVRPLPDEPPEDLPRPNCSGRPSAAKASCCP